MLARTISLWRRDGTMQYAPHVQACRNTHTPPWQIGSASV
jgi:hypothetical protein